MIIKFHVFHTVMQPNRSLNRCINLNMWLFCALSTHQHIFNAHRNCYLYTFVIHTLSLKHYLQISAFSTESTPTSWCCY